MLLKRSLPDPPLKTILLTGPLTFCQVDPTKTLVRVLSLATATMLPALSAVRVRTPPLRALLTDGRQRSSSDSMPRRGLRAGRPAWRTVAARDGNSLLNSFIGMPLADWPPAGGGEFWPRLVGVIHPRP